ncbi:MAG: molybdopterin-synthase adenylyltransferase MoeB [Pseudomonadota bacterium]
MIVVLALAAGLWLLGRSFGAPVSARLIMIGLLYVAVLAATIALPENNPLVQAIGGSAGEWMVVGGLGAAAWGYFQVLGRLRQRVRPENRPKAAAATDDARRNRAMRHIVLREIGGMGQKRIEDARVLVVGAGGLGSPVLQYLAAAGVGTLGVIDDDVVETTNLQRQTIHTDARIGMPKVFSAEAALAPQNPFVAIRPYNRRLTEGIAADLFADYDLVIDGTDDVETRYVVNAAAVAAQVPLVSGAISQWEGQVSVFDPARGAPCYACVFPVAAAPGVSATCAEAGVASPLPGMMGSLMALEAIKVITDAGTPLRGRMAIYDGLGAETRTIKIARNRECQVCGTRA